MSAQIRKGLRIKFVKNVDLEIHNNILAYAIWLRKQIEFPVRVPAYIKESKYIKSVDGN